jgi:hypothetical protein
MLEQYPGMTPRLFLAALTASCSICDPPTVSVSAKFQFGYVGELLCLAVECVSYYPKIR